MTLPNPRFEESYARVFGGDVAMDDRADAFFSAFYDRFTADESVGRLFERTDRSRQVQMLKKSLFQLVSFYVVSNPTAELERLRDLHNRLRLPPAMFDVWMEALLDTVRQFDEQFDETTQLAWCWALAPGIAFMQHQLRLAPGEGTVSTFPHG